MIYSYSEFLLEKKKNRDTSYAKNILFDQIHKSVPIEIIKIILDEWSFIYYKSPYGQSYYSEKVSWGHKPHNSYRMSDHWNFYAKGKKHCETSNSVENDTHWSIGKFNIKTKKYKIILSLPKVDSIENDDKIRELKKEYYKNNQAEIDKHYKDIQNRTEKNYLLGKEKRVLIAKFLYDNVKELQILVNDEQIDNIIQFTTTKVRYLDENDEKIIIRSKRFKNTDIKVYYKDQLIINKPSGSGVNMNDVYNSIINIVN